MAKESGLGFTAFSVDDSAGVVKTIVNDIRSAEFGTPIAVQDITGLDKSAIERLHLLADFTTAMTGVFNDATSQAHDTFTPLSNARTVTITHSGNTLANECLLTDYGLTRGEDGSLMWSVPAVLQSGTVPVWT
jgi:hypothetical protein